MPITFSCPKCSGTLRVPDAMAGKQGKCPKCKSMFSIPGGAPAAAQAGASRKPAAAEEAVSVPVVDEDDVPVLGDDDDDRPRRRRDRDRDDDYDDDDRGRGRRRGRDRGDDVDDEADEDRPRRRPGSGRKIVKWVVISAGSVVVLGAAAFLLWYLLKSPDVDERWLPDNTFMVRCENFDRIRDSSMAKSLEWTGQGNSEAIYGGGVPRWLGLKGANISKLITVMAEKANPYYIIHLTESKSGKDIASRAEGTYEESTIGKHTVFVKKGGTEAYALPLGRLLLAGHKDDLKKVLERDGKAKLSDDMRTAIKKMSTSYPSSFGMTAGPNKEMEGLKYAHGYSDYELLSANGKIVMEFKDSSSAAKMKEKAQSGALEQALGIAFIFGKPTVTHSGTTVTIEWSVADALRDIKIR
jgi:hypothetical protein